MEDLIKIADVLDEVNSFPVVTLSNGLRIANFNSPHSFLFEDGNVLDAVNDEIARSTQLLSDDESSFNGKFYCISKGFKMSDVCKRRIDVALNFLTHYKKIDVILVPLPVLQAMKDAGIRNPNMFTIFVVDRITKAISINKFCQ